MKSLLRPALAVAAGLSLVAGGAAVAAPKPVCNLLTDAAGDANGVFLAEGGVPGAPSEDAVDIVSADIASTKKLVTTALRVKKLVTSSPTAPGGLHWKFFFNVGGEQVYTQAVAPAGGAVSFTFGTIDGTTGTSTSLGPAEGVLDLAKNEVRVTVPAGALPATPKLGTKITDLAPNAGRFVGNDAALTFSDSTDTATSDKTYTAGAASCVVPGK